MKYICAKNRFALTNISWLSVFFITILVTASIRAQLTDSDFMELERQSKERGWTFSIGPTEASQRPSEYLGNVVFTEEFWEEQAARPPHTEPPHKAALPSRFDWREQVTGPLPLVKDQGYCGACWAFASTTVLEWAIKIHDGDRVDLSAQWLLACNSALFGNDCNGGFIQLGYFKDK